MTEGTDIPMSRRKDTQTIERSTAAAEQAVRVCPLAHLCLNGLRCRTRTFLVCEWHEPLLYICPIKNRGRACPACGGWIARVVPAANGDTTQGTQRPQAHEGSSGASARQPRSAPRRDPPHVDGHSQEPE